MRVALLHEADAPAYRALMLEAYERDPDAFTSTVDERASEPLSFWVERIAGAGGRSVVFGGFDGPRLVGSVALEFSARPKTWHKAKVLAMYVVPASRGAGFGRALVEAAIAHAAGRPGLRVLTLTVTEGNPAAIRLYQRCGFEAFGTEPLAIGTPRGYLAKVHMWRAVDAPWPGSFTHG